MTDIQTQIDLEELFNKNQTLDRLRNEFRRPEVTDHCEENEIPIPFALDLLSQMVLHKRATISVLVGLLHRHFAPDPDDTPKVPSTEQLQACADMILFSAAAGLVTWDSMSGQMIIRIDVAPDVHEDLELYQYPLPFLMPPKEVKTNRDTGFYSPGSAKGSLILKHNHHDDDICLDHINRVNQTRLSVNIATAAMIQNSWRHLDKPKEGESKKDYAQRVTAFEKYDRCSRDILQHLMITGNEFYLSHRYDKRGRCYAQGYHVNYQGNDWNKAVIEFAEPEIIELVSQSAEKTLERKVA